MRLPAPLYALPLMALPLAACATTQDAEPPALATATVQNAAGATIGTAIIRQDAAGMALQLDVSGMAPGSYGAHVHTVGQCAGPAFASAGGHWNPGGKQHGRLNPMGSHMGDLPNLVVGTNGTGSIRYALPGTATGEGGLLDADGAAIVIHANADDEHTDPSGNSGARVACGVLVPTP